MTLFHDIQDPVLFGIFLRGQGGFRSTVLLYHIILQFLRTFKFSTINIIHIMRRQTILLQQ